MMHVAEERSQSTVKVMSHDEDIERNGDVAELRKGAGLLWLSTDGGLLHMNHRGAELLKQICEPSSPNSPLMPHVITALCTEIGTLCRGPVNSKEWEDFEIRRVCGPLERPILVRAFCMPSARKDKRAHVLIMLEPLAPRQTIQDQGKERFQLTNREQHIVEHLAKGWTNKEIACALGITEPTVKAHMKHIMQKTKCTTRTGVLAQLM